MTNTRIQLSRWAAAALLFIFLFTSHSWDQEGLWDAVIDLTGLALIAIGSYGRIWSFLYICGRKTDRLVTEGPYSIVRNPLYLFSFIAATGLGLASKNVLVLSAVVLLFAAYYPFTVLAEERVLARVHGAEFDRYAARVPRFFPRTWTVREPDVYEVYPRKFKRVFFDAMWFVWIYIFMQLVERLRGLEILPTFWRIF